ncbi:putative quinol monooxygenase [Humitalea sp. 24SJ18S-53]|uniref:putative quinol monooxygenase n=1 Tax=Humitalea sp. 24SJ18S-53 TaxID=3422307 RepID=UPI003D66E04B
MRDVTTIDADPQDLALVPEVHVVSRLRLRPECWLRLLQAMPSFMAATRSEPGCLDYDLYVSATRTGEVTTVARWADQAAATAHLAAQHTRSFFMLTTDCAAAGPHIVTLAPLREGV